MTTDQIIMLSKILPCIPEDFQEFSTCAVNWCSTCSSIFPGKHRPYTCIANVIGRYPLIRTNFYKHYPEFNI